MTTTLERDTGLSYQMVEQGLRGEALTIPFDAHLLPNDPVCELLSEAGVAGIPIAEVDAGKQTFAIIDVSTAASATRENFYEPFIDKRFAKADTPTRFELRTQPPLVLMHLDKQSGQLTARALRPNDPIHIGRDAAKIDPKSSRFDYQQDNSLSRDHLSITLDPDNGLLIHDHNSTNGTTVRFAARVDNDIKQIITDVPTKEPHETASKNRSEAALTDEVMLIPELFPKQKITTGDREFYLSNIVRSGRDYAVLYTDIVKNGRKQAVPRMLYKSQSDGGWRVAYGVDASGRFIKEAHRHESHYTQETKLHPNILTGLEQAEVVSDMHHSVANRITGLFMSTNPKLAEVDTAEEEIKYHKDSAIDAKLEKIRYISAGHLTEWDLKEVSDEFGVKTFSEYMRSLDKVFESLPGFVPDFTGLPEKVVIRQHTLLGEIKIEDYIGVLGNKPVVWSLAQDRLGRTWVENLRLAGSKVSSYGNYATILDGGVITNKPLEYISQTTGLQAGEAIIFDREYQDITPLLENLLPIRKYLEAKRK